MRINSELNFNISQTHRILKVKTLCTVHTYIHTCICIYIYAACDNDVVHHFSYRSDGSSVGWSQLHTCIYFGVRLFVYLCCCCWTLFLWYFHKSTTLLYVSFSPCANRFGQTNSKKRSGAKKSYHFNVQANVLPTAHAPLNFSCTLTYSRSLDWRDMQAKWVLRSPLQQFSTVCFLVLFLRGSTGNSIWILWVECVYVLVLCQFK